MKKTRKAERFLRQIESHILMENIYEENYPIEYVIDTLEKVTILNEMQKDPNCIKRLVNNDYGNTNWNEHGLKLFLVVSYPLILIETKLMNKEYRPFINDISAGLYFYKKNRLNACTFRTDEGEDVVLFSDWLYGYIWKQCSLGVQNESNYAAILLEDIITKRFKNWSTKNIVSYKDTNKEIALSVTLNQVFIVLHEIAHILLGHSKSKKAIVRAFGDTELKIVELNHEMEYDADMLASDMFLKFLKLNFQDYFQYFMVGIDVLRSFAKIEYISDYDYENLTGSHPPAGFRNIYIYLRHEEEFRKNGKSTIIDSIKKAFLEKNHSLSYNFKKDFDYEKYVMKKRNEG